MAKQPTLPFDLQVAATVRGRRRARRWSQERLALKANCARKTVTRLEGGSPVSTQTLMDVLRVLDIDPFELDERVAGERQLHLGTNALRSLRFDRRLTLEQCAGAAGLSAATLSRWERAAFHPAKLVTVRPDGSWFASHMGLARALGFAGLRSFTKALGGYDEFAPPDPMITGRAARAD